MKTCLNYYFDFILDIVIKKKEVVKMEKKIISYAQYKEATAWEKLSFLATAKHQGQHLVELSTIIYTDTIRTNKLILVNR